MATTPNVLKRCVFSILSIMILVPVAAIGGEPLSPSDLPGAVIDTQSLPLEAKGYAVQVGSFHKLNLAKREVSRLREKGADPFYQYEDTGSKGMWYRVYAGRYPTREEARQTAESLVQRRLVKTYQLRNMRVEKNDGRAVTPREAGSISADPRRKIKPPTAPRRESGRAPIVAGVVPTGSTAIRLTLMDAIRYSLKGNREIGIAAYDPKQAWAQIETEESAFDPLLFADATIRRDPNLDASTTDIVTEDDRRARAGIRKPLKTGGSLSAYLETRYADTNNGLAPRTYKHIVSPTLELRQPLLNNIGSKKERTAIRIANHRADISAADFRRKVIEVTTQVAKVYWKLFLFKELIEINRVNLDMAEEVHRRAYERFARGLSQQLDVARARSNADVRRSALLRSRKEYKLAMDRLKLLLNWQDLTIDSDTAIIPVEAPRTDSQAPDETDAIETALSNRPEIIKAQQELMVRESEVKLAAHQRLPKLDAFGRYSASGYGREDDRAWKDVSVNDDDIWEVGVAFEWALGNRAAKSRFRRKSLRRKQADAQLKRVEDEIKLDVKQVLHQLATARGELEANRSAKEAAEKVVEGEFTRFDIGQTSNEELLRAQDLLAMTSRSFARAVAEYNTTLQELTRAQGMLPDNITIEETSR